MDFFVAAPGGVAAGNPAALNARGPEPAISIPPGAHFFRRVSDLTMMVAPGALVAVPSLLGQSIVDFVFGCTIRVPNGVLNSRPALLVKVHPAKFEQALAQLESEPAGIGLDPNAFYSSLEEAASEVAAAMERVKARAGPLAPSYVLAAGDVYDLEPVAPNALGSFVTLTQGPTALTLEHLSVNGWLVHYGFLHFVCLGNSLSASRDGPQQATRRVLLQISTFAVAENLSSPIPVGQLVEASSLVIWLSLTIVTNGAVLGYFTSVPSSREQNVRDRHTLRYGSIDQKSVLVASLVLREPLRTRLKNVNRVLGSNANVGDIAAAGLRLWRLVRGSSSAHLDSIDAFESLDVALEEPVRSLSTPGANVATLAGRLKLIEDVFGKALKGSDGKAAPSSSYSSALTGLLDANEWRTTEASLLAELSSAAPRAVVVMELLTNSSVVGARRLALGVKKSENEELSRLISLSAPLSQALDFLAVTGGDDADSIRRRAVADMLVADPITRLPSTAEQTAFYLTFPPLVAKQILRGAFDETDWIGLLRLVLQANNPGMEIPTYEMRFYDPTVGAQIIPLLDRVSKFLGIPLSPPAPPAVVPANWATLRSIVVSVGSNYSSIKGVISGYEESNLAKLAAFEQAAWGEAAGVFNRMRGSKNPAGAPLVSVFEVNSGAMAKLSQLTKALSEQRAAAANQPELFALQQQIASHGSLDALIDAKLAQRPRSRAGPAPHSPSVPSSSTARGGTPSAETRGRQSSRGVADRSRSREPSQERGSSRGKERELSASQEKTAASRSQSPSRSSQQLGTRFVDTVRHGADGRTFWYVNKAGVKASVVYDYVELEKLAGRTRQELDFPVVCSKGRSPAVRAELCCAPGTAGHEHAGSSAHIPPFADFADAAERLFQAPARV